MALICFYTGFVSHMQFSAFLTRHVDHPAVAHAHDLVGLAEQATGADAVRVVSRELLPAGGAAVPPGLGQVGQLSTQTFIRLG